VPCLASGGVFRVHERQGPCAVSSQCGDVATLRFLVSSGAASIWLVMGCADKKEAKEAKKMQAEIDADFEAKYGPTRKANTTVVATNQVPADDDMVGGAAGKTFTTHTTMKVSTGYAKIRETVGKD
jgi:hypothetical protein